MLMSIQMFALDDQSKLKESQFCNIDKILFIFFMQHQNTSFIDQNSCRNCVTVLLLNIFCL